MLKVFVVHVAQIALQIMVVIIFIVAVIIYRTIITLLLFQWTEFNESFVSQKLGLDPQLIASMSSACINLVFIMVMGYVRLCWFALHCSKEPYFRLALAMFLSSWRLPIR